MPRFQENRLFLNDLYPLCGASVENLALWAPRATQLVSQWTPSRHFPECLPGFSLRPPSSAQRGMSGPVVHTDSFTSTPHLCPSTASSPGEPDQQGIHPRRPALVTIAASLPGTQALLSELQEVMSLSVRSLPIPKPNFLVTRQRSFRQLLQASMATKFSSNLTRLPCLLYYSKIYVT